MRYLGNKESIVENIINVLERHNLLNNNMTFFDAFCGTGTVSDYLKNYYRIILNDNLLFPVLFSKGRILSQTISFEKLGFDPISYFNNNTNIICGFFTKNYAPQYSGRMYFSDFNAGRIDYFRNEIDNWFNLQLITDDEYAYLIGCLLESVSKVANVAGVYGAYLKHWDSRAIKEIKFIPIESNRSNNVPMIKKTYNSNLIDIIENVECDILYLDPPYTKNKYSVQYHLLETLVRNDNPVLKGITGTRDLSWISQAWSTKNQVEIEFEKVIATTKAKYIIMSYSSDGLMSKDFIMNVLKRHCYDKTIDFIKIEYKKYRNFKTYSTDEHYEYIIYAEKKKKNDVVYYCPLNYMGGKTNIINHINPFLNNKSKLIDLMGGGFNVGCNSIGFTNYIYNDINYTVKDILNMFKNEDTKKILDSIDKIIKKYSLEKNNKESYVKYRDDYNNKYRKLTNYPIYLFTLVLYGFQQQLRFNSKHEFNNPVGESGYNDSIKEKIVSFSRRLKELNPLFLSTDYEQLYDYVDGDTLVYIDPPYLITLGSYNDGKRGFNGWNEIEEVRLIKFIDSIKSKGAKILISNIINYKGKTNAYLREWISENNPITKKILIRGREEVLIIYERKVYN